MLSDISVAVSVSQILEDSQPHDMVTVEILDPCPQVAGDREERVVPLDVSIICRSHEPVTESDFQQIGRISLGSSNSVRFGSSSVSEQWSSFHQERS